jgi:hypothetical protein
MRSLLRSLFIACILLCTLHVSAQKNGGKVTTPKKGYDVIHPYNKKGWARVERDKKIGYIDRAGTEVVPCRYDDIYPYEKGIAKVLLDAKFGLITDVAEAEPLVEPKYDYIGPFKNGLALVSLGGRRGLIDLEGKEVVPLAD